MMSTEELNDYVRREIYDRIGNNLDKLLFFDDGKYNNVEGTHIYSDDKGYHIIEIKEYGVTASDILTDSEREVLWHAIEGTVFNLALDYEKKNREKGKDHRRKLFSKMIELYSLFGKDFETRIKKEIEGILEKYPYNDRKDPFEVQEEKEYEIRNYLQAIFNDIQGYSKSRFSMKHFTPEGEIKYKDMDLAKIISDTECYIWVYFDVQEPKEEITQEVIRRLNQINAVPEDLSIQIGDLRKNYASFHRSKTGNLERK